MQRNEDPGQSNLRGPCHTQEESDRETRFLARHHSIPLQISFQHETNRGLTHEHPLATVIIGPIERLAIALLRSKQSPTHRDVLRHIFQYTEQ